MKKCTPVEQIRKKTYDEVLQKLKQPAHMVAVPRPTGFGKTCLAVKLIKSGVYKHILYLYPTKIIRNTVIERYYADFDDPEDIQMFTDIGHIQGVTMMTYSKLARTAETDDILKGYDLIIFDECHKMAANKTLPRVYLLFNLNKTAHMVGLTATPNRTDGFDVIENIFHGITVSPYTLHDCFKNKIFKIPRYCYLPCNQDKLPKKVVEDALTAGQDIASEHYPWVKQVMKRKYLEMLDICSMEKSIKQTCDQYVDTNYMKFICFFSRHSMLLSKSKNVVNWFSKAYPDHQIRITEVTSRKKVTQENIDKLNALTVTDKTIDLILCVDMLNMGYHVSDITGIVMYRTTTSDIIYPQEFGRVLASGCTKEHIIFDIVDNIHRKAASINPLAPCRATTNGRSNTAVATDSNMITVAGLSDTKPADDGIDTFITDSDSAYTAATNTNDKKSDLPWWKTMNTLTSDDILEAPAMALYREMMAKVVGEPMQMRCKEAFEAHFHLWCDANGIPYPISQHDLKAIWGYDKQDFINYFAEKIKNNNLNYPMGDAVQLLQIGAHNDGVPLSVFAKWKNISVRQILDLLGIVEPEDNSTVPAIA